jgi:hypothetical protein
VTTQFNDLGLAGPYLTLWLSRLVTDPTVGAILLLVSLALILLVAGTRRTREFSITWTRRRLWPSLQDGEIVDAETVAP